MTSTGPFLFHPAEAPRYMTALKVLCGMYSAAILFSSLLCLELFTANRRRDRAQAGASDAEGDSKGFSAMTDLENDAFRYHV